MALRQPQDDAEAVRGELARARHALSEASQRTEESSASLPEPGQRSAGQRATARVAHDAARSARSVFIDTHAEAVYDDDAIKNDLCAPIPTPDVAADWLRNMLSDLRNAKRWAAEKALRTWIAEHRLSGAGFPDTGAASSPEGIRILERLREARPRAAANLARLVAELDRPL